ncbi:MAG: type II toxin-antitoxin system HicA family toxin [Candidatus Bipolaricaulota bacterium]|nr:type II toxin-antitoxin system HicA family toxin [Candidatus Bipolaricaulota bacterium]MDW8140747.1 type II toxin-antitoxin system HicA family toxin [Candidatus Bipolaricaulota bacterium]
MARLGAISRQELIRSLRKFGFIGPLPGAKHEYMVRGTTRIILPNPHRSEISPALLSQILKQAGISRKEWEEHH